LQGLCRSPRQCVRVGVRAENAGRRAGMRAELVHLEHFPCKTENLLAHLTPESIIGGPSCAGT